MKMKVIRVESRKNGSSAGGSLGYRKDPERKKKTINMQKKKFNMYFQLFENFPFFLKIQIFVRLHVLSLTSSMFTFPSTCSTTTFQPL